MFAILVLVVVARAVAAPTVAANKTSSRVDADEKRLLGAMQTLSSRLWGKPTQRREEDEEEEKRKKALPKRKGKGKGKPETRNLIIRSIIRSTRAAKEREREREKRSPFESAGGHKRRESARSRFNCRFCGDDFPDKSIRRGTSQTRESARASFREII